jgi:trans-2,3-dihydro-3-hydroxyanthranilate isomerase
VSHAFVIADVFTSTAFGGNQLAVFLDGRGLSTRAMQAIAREINFSESTFLLPPEDPAHTRRVRIFTPGKEVPFAGHPTVGTAAVLAQRGLVALNDGHATVVLGEGVGPVPVDIAARGGALTCRFTLERGLERPADAPSLTAAAATLSLPNEAVVDAWFASVGLPFCFVRLINRDAVDRATLVRSTWAAHFAHAWASDIMLFAGGGGPGERIYARMFGPSVGVEEDPATGSAAAALAASLADAAPAREGAFSWNIDQGVAMGRPSVIEISADKRDGRTFRVRVGGNTVVTGEGSITVPAGY